MLLLTTCLQGCNILATTHKDLFSTASAKKGGEEEQETQNFAGEYLFATYLKDLQDQAKKNLAKFSDTCSVKADGLCIGC